MGDFGKIFNKQLNRTKEKIRQNFGKADKTTDEVYEDHLVNFHKQQKGAEKLQKELKNYATSLKAAAAASKLYYEAVREVYEPEWPGVEHVKAMTQSIELLWEDFCRKLEDQAVNPMLSYNNRFPEMKAKIEKRGRKLLDYDNTRHNLEAVQKEKKKDDTKLQKASEAMHDAKKLYDDLNSELHEELPTLYDERVPFYAANFQTVFQLEETFHTENGKLSRDIIRQIDKLGESAHKLRTPRVTSVNGGVKETRPASQQSNDSKRRSVETEGDISSASPIAKDIKVTPARPKAPETVQPTPESPKAEEKKLESPKPEDKSASEKPPTSLYPKVDDAAESEDKKSLNPFDTDGERSPSPPAAEKKVAMDAVEPEKVAETKPPVEADLPVKTSDSSSTHKSVPTLPATTEPAKEEEKESAESLEKSEQIQKQHKVLYRVRATHKYGAEDTDELSFEAGDFISVISYDDPEEQDEGWLLGIKESTGDKGVFPANFTKPL